MFKSDELCLQALPLHIDSACQHWNRGNINYTILLLGTFAQVTQQIRITQNIRKVLPKQKKLLLVKFWCGGSNLHLQLRGRPLYLFDTTTQVFTKFLILSFFQSSGEGALGQVLQPLLRHGHAWPRVERQGLELGHRQLRRSCHEFPGWGNLKILVKNRGLRRNDANGR